MTVLIQRSQSAFARRFGEWAVVTGASDGIGRAFAVECARRGLSVVLIARRAEVLERLAAGLRADFGVQAQALAADLADPSAVAAIGAATRDLDVGLVVAAAGFGTSGEFIGLPPDEELRMIDVNCRAVTAVSHLFANRFAGRGRGGIVLLSSLLAFQGVARAATYAATKAFVQSLAEGLRLELGPRGVAVIATAPGPTHSGFADRARMTMTRAVAPETVASATLDALGRRTTVRPGLLSKVLEWSLKTGPRPVRVRMLSRVMASMTSHQATGDGS